MNSRTLELAAAQVAQGAAALPSHAADFGVRGWADLVPASFSAPAGSVRAFAPAFVVLFSACFLLFGGVITGLAIAPAALALRLWHARRTVRPSVADRMIDGRARLTELRVRKALETQPQHPGLRMLWAATLLEKGQHLASLVQLAPLRDRFPGSGEVVLLAAANYAHLGRAQDSMRMLQALKITPEHPSFPAAVELYRNCLGELRPAI